MKTYEELDREVTKWVTNTSKGNAYGYKGDKLIFKDEDDVETWYDDNGNEIQR